MLRDCDEAGIDRGRPAGSGGFNVDEALQVMLGVFAEMDDDLRTIVVRFKKRQNKPSAGKC
jgi:hypothetical protein